ncbi:unnamed protein product [Ectocarpus sp. 6 AP-2014]
MNDNFLGKNHYTSLCETPAPSSDVGETNINMARCPFYEKPVDEIQSIQSAKYAKRSQRHRSTAQSRLGDMTVGDIRYCFQQLRNAGKDLSPDMMLYNGQSAGEFALKYLRETSTATRKRRKSLSVVARRSVANKKDSGGRRGKDNALSMDGCTSRRAPGLNVLEF